MKAIITVASLVALFTSASLAQEKTTSDKIKVKKEPCFVSEFDANGKEIKVPCSTTKKKSANAANPLQSQSPVTRNNPILISKEIDPATGFASFFKTDFDHSGAEIKRKVSVVEEFDAAGKSSLFIKEVDAAGNKVLVPAKIQH